MIQDNEDKNDAKEFDVETLKKYPRSNRRLSLAVSPYGIRDDSDDPTATTVHISPHGMQFRCDHHYPEGTLLKIQIALPDYWSRKQRYVEYGRIDTPDSFKILAKVVSSENIGKRGKKNVVVVKTVNMDEVDEQVLKTYLQEG